MDSINSDVQFLLMLRKLSDNCRTNRIAKGWSPLDLAANANVAIQTIYNMENGSGNITIKTLASISCALEIPFENLLK